jgi:integrase
VIVCLREWRQVAKRTEPADFILSGRNGDPMDQARMLRSHIKPACEELGLPKATWLTFRRTFSTWADERGVSAKIRAELMGHGPEINQTIYTKVIPDTLRKAVESVGSKLFANCSHGEKFGELSNRV